jgi:hypothetical protein
MRTGPISEESADLVWQSHPARSRPGRTATALAVIGVISVACAMAGHSILWGAFAALVLICSLDTYFFPCRYLLRQETLEVRRPFSRSTRAWSSFRRVYRDPRGLTLSPYGHRTMLEPYRALRILFDGGDQAQIEARIRSALDPSVEWIEVPPR